MSSCALACAVEALATAGGADWKHLPAGTNSPFDWPAARWPPSQRPGEYVRSLLHVSQSDIETAILAVCLILRLERSPAPTPTRTSKTSPPSATAPRLDLRRFHRSFVPALQLADKLHNDLHLSVSGWVAAAGDVFTVKLFAPWNGTCWRHSISAQW